MGSFFRTEGSRLIREYRNEILWIEPWGANSLRVRGTKRAAMEQQQDWALLPGPGGDAAEISISDDGRSAEIRNG
ncbi:MAG TPA: family 31 glucosidase, partial [Clostridiales bacterium]|nr:family 31 glucosidase [Clostridiales bacterium]